MKAIVGLYIKMLQHLGVTTPMQYKRRVTKADLRYFCITPEQHQVKYALQALEHINKTPLKRKPSVGERLIDKYRPRKLAEINRRIANCPADSPEQIALRRIRDSIEEQDRPPTGTA